MGSKKHKVQDYIVLSIPENPGLFAIERRAHGQERFLVSDPKGSGTGPVYHSIAHLVSPFLNYETGASGESCTCLSWRTRKKRCVHLDAFFALNPHLDKKIVKEPPTFNSPNSFNILDPKGVKKLVEE